MSDVKRYEAVHLRSDENSIYYCEGCEVEVVRASDYAALEAECERLRTQLTSHVEWDGEVVEVVAWRIEHPAKQWKVYEQRQDWAYQEYGHIKYKVQDLMSVAQHERIVAALLASRGRGEV